MSIIHRFLFWFIHIWTVDIFYYLRLFIGFLNLCICMDVSNVLAMLIWLRWLLNPASIPIWKATLLPSIPTLYEIGVWTLAEI